MRYSVQTRERIFEKAYGFLSFAKNMCENTGRNISKNVNGILYLAKNFLIVLKDLQNVHLKLLQKDSFKKQQKQLVIRLVTKLLTELQKFIAE